MSDQEVYIYIITFICLCKEVLFNFQLSSQQNWSLSARIHGSQNSVIAGLDDYTKPYRTQMLTYHQQSLILYYAKQVQ